MVSESVPAPAPTHEEYEALKRRVKELEEQKKRDDERYEKLKQQFDELRRRMEQLLRLRFGGAKNEQVSRDQLEAPFNGAHGPIDSSPPNKVGGGTSTERFAPWPSSGFASFMPCSNPARPMTRAVWKPASASTRALTPPVSGQREPATHPPLSTLKAIAF
jgi:hypothetical protein